MSEVVDPNIQNPPNPGTPAPDPTPSAGSPPPSAPGGGTPVDGGGGGSAISELQAQLEALKATNAELQQFKEKTEKASMTELQQREAENAALKQQLAQVQRTALLAEAGVPEELRPLLVVPEGATVKTVRAALDKLRSSASVAPGSGAGGGRLQPASTELKSADQKAAAEAAKRKQEMNDGWNKRLSPVRPSQQG